MTLLVMVLAGLGFLALVMASIGLHELGHLVPAKLFGVKVTQYFVGFGPTLWSTRRGETEYGLKAVPLGGFCRLVGMYPPERTAARKGWLERFADEARGVEYDDITPADDGRLLYQQPWWQKVVVMAGGITTNALLAFVVLAAVNGLHGTWRPQLVAEAVSECVVPAGAARPCAAGDPEAPAHRAGVRPGDRVVSFNQTAVGDWAQLQDLIRANRDRPASVVVERDGRRVQLPAVPTVVTGVRDRLDPSRTVEAGFWGVTPSYRLERTGLASTAGDLWLQARRSVVSLVQLPVKVAHVAAAVVTGRDRDADGPVSVVGASRAAGEIAGSHDMGTGDKVASWFAMLASLNLFVALLNCVPLPPLDGGHIASALYEQCRRSLARLAGRPDPGPFDTARLLPVSYVVGGLLGVAGVILVIADLVSPVRVF